MYFFSTLFFPILPFYFKWSLVIIFTVLSYLFFFSDIMIKQINVEELWESADAGGWRPSSAPRSDWPRECSILPVEKEK